MQLDLFSVIDVPHKPTANLFENPSSNITYFDDKISYTPITNRPAQGDYVSSFVQYKADGLQPHPSKLVESKVFANIPLPKVSYTPKIPLETIQKGMISENQYEDLILIGAAHNQTFPDTDITKGFMVGSGTGYGKGNTIAGAILDRLNNGDNRAVWISKNDKAHAKSPQYFQDVGGNKKHLIYHDKYPLNANLPNLDKGVLITTYPLLRSSQNIDDEPELITGRIKQVMDFLGKDFNGIIVFDESHLMANAVDTQADRGVKKSSQTARIGLFLQNHYPKAKILYVSATNSSKLENLVYAKRLGIYGEGTAFKDANDFISQMKTRELQSLELIARDLKAQGLYTSKSLSYDGIEYKKLVHQITAEQSALYNNLALIWQKILHHINEVVEIISCSTKNRGAYYSTFWGAHQRFFKQILITLQLSTLIDDITFELQQENSIVIQLTITNESMLKRAIAANDANEINMSPKYIIEEFLHYCFPTQQYEDFIDENGNEANRLMKDAEGNTIVNQEAVAIQQELLNSLEDLYVPSGSIDTIINHFGVDNVAEITGRSIRLLLNPQSNKYEVCKIPKSNATKDLLAFNKKEKRILIFSEAGGTGADYHASNNIINQQTRIHYVLDPGWTADKAIQGFGRTNRSNQRVPPVYKLCTTNLKSQLRFLTTIAKRLEKLGAITKGQKSTGGQGIFNDNYNFDSDFGQQALFQTYSQIIHFAKPFSVAFIKQKMGISLVDEDGKPSQDNSILFDIRTFLNRLMSLEIHYMDQLFEAFNTNFNRVIEKNIADGKIKKSVETFDSRPKLLKEETIFTTDHGATTQLATFQFQEKNEKSSFQDILFQKEFSNNQFMGFYQQEVSKNVYAIFHFQDTFINDTPVTEYRRSGVKDKSIITDISKYHKVNEIQAQTLWTNQYNSYPDFYKVERSIIKGVILPIYKYLNYENTDVHEYTDQNDQKHLGVFIPNSFIPVLKQKLNIIKTIGVNDINLDDKNIQTIIINHGIKIKRTKHYEHPAWAFTATTKVENEILEDLGAIIQVTNKMLNTSSVLVLHKNFKKVLTAFLQKNNYTITSTH